MRDYKFLHNNYKVLFRGTGYIYHGLKIDSDDVIYLELSKFNKTYLINIHNLESLYRSNPAIADILKCINDVIFHQELQEIIK